MLHVRLKRWCCWCVVHFLNLVSMQTLDFLVDRFPLFQANDKERFIISSPLAAKSLAHFLCLSFLVVWWNACV